jgi:metal-responsive CopG/Arc/MetJ family transcriptional regulator
MEQITLRLPVRTLAELEREAAKHGRSRSEHIRDVLESRQDAPADAPNPERVRELETRIDDLRGDLQHERARADELQGMLKAAHRRNDEVEAVVEYVEGRKGVVGRAKAWLFGRE